MIHAVASVLSRSLLIAAAALVFALPGAAVPTGFQVVISAEDAGGTSLGSQDLDGLITAGLIGESSDTGAGTESIFLTGPMTAGTGWTVGDWGSTVKPDPWITNNFQLTNNTGGTATFTVSVSTPIPLFAANEIVESNILLQINDDPNDGGATLTNASPTAIYEAFVNGGSVLTLLDSDPYTLTCSSPSDCSPPGVANGQDGDEVISQFFGPVGATSIGITIKFTLSDGDSATVLSRFEIVPEPGTALLLGFGLIAMAGARRRSY